MHCNFSKLVTNTQLCADVSILFLQHITKMKVGSRRSGTSASIQNDTDCIMFIDYTVWREHFH